MDLPLDCEASYYSDFVTSAESKALFETIRESCDLSDIVIRMADGQQVRRNVGQFVFADPAIVESPLAEPAGHRQHWIPAIQDAKQKVESVVNRIYNVCIGYYYKDGNSGFDYHFDHPAHGDDSIVACVSLGQERVFSFRHIDNHNDTYDLRLGDGSLLIMGRHCRARYEHALPIDPDAMQPRIVMTFQDFGWN